MRPTMVTALSRLETVLDGYDALLCDVWGVLHNGRGVFPAAAAALSAARARGLTVILVSNVPKPWDVIPGQLDRLGCPRDAWDAIVTSGDAIRAELALRAPGPVRTIGPPVDASLWADLGLAFTDDLSTAAFFAVSGLHDPLTETVAEYAGLLGQARSRNLELLCANPDLVVRMGDQLVACAGALAQEYERMGGRVVMAGKPHPPIYARAFAAVEERRGGTDRSRILAIGDGVGTDIRGANAQGIDALFIASGIHGAELGDGAPETDAVSSLLSRQGAHARYVMEHLE